MKKTITLIIFIILILILFSFAIVKPQNGRKYTIHVIDTIVLQADPPAKKLIKYMNKKYDKNFVQVNVEPLWETPQMRHHEYGSGAWDYFCNGITVTTDDSNGEYYHVRDDYGTYLDNYGCYLVNGDAEAELNKKVSAVVKDSKVSCFPRDMQYKELPAYMTVQEYLENAMLRICIVICGEGGDARNDYDKICKALNMTSGGRGGRLTMLYLDKDEYENVDMSEFQSFESIIDTKNYNMRLKFDVHTSEPLFVTPE